MNKKLIHLHPRSHHFLRLQQFNIFLWALAPCIVLSCGILQGNRGEPTYDPEFHKRRLAELNARKETRQQDSLVREILAAPLAIPEDLKEKWLIVETYDYEGFRDTQTTKLYRPPDNEKTRKQFKRYDKKKSFLLPYYKHKLIYADRTNYEKFNPDEFRYVLKSATRIQDEKSLVIYTDGTSAGWVAVQFFYIYDRKTGKVFGEIDDVKKLTSL